MQEQTKPHTQFSTPPSTPSSTQQQGAGKSQAGSWSGKQSGGADESSPQSRLGDSSDIKEAAKRAEERLGDAGSEVRERLDKAASDGRSRLCQEIRNVGEAADSAADCLNEEDQERLGGYVRGIRRQCDRAAGYLEDRSVQSLTSDLSHLARRNPALFVGGAMALGLAAGRFLSARPPQPRHDSRSAGQPGGGQPGGSSQPWGGQTGGSQPGQSQPWGAQPASSQDHRRTQSGYPEDRPAGRYQSGSQVGASGASPVTPPRSSTSSTPPTSPASGRMGSSKFDDSAD